MKNCAKMTRLASDTQERELAFGEKLQLHTHLMMCKACRQFYKNNLVLSQMIKTLKDYEITEQNKD